MVDSDISELFLRDKSSDDVSDVVDAGKTCDSGSHGFAACAELCPQCLVHTGPSCSTLLPDLDRHVGIHDADVTDPLPLETSLFLCDDDEGEVDWMMALISTASLLAPI